MLKVFKNSTDISIEMEDFTEDYAFGVLASGDYIYVGYDKPLSALSIELDKTAKDGRTLSVDYYNGSSFASVSNLIDRTFALAECGLVEWDRNNDVDEEKTTVNSLEKYWYRISVDVDTHSITMRGINLLFTTDKDLAEEASYLLSADYYPEGEPSFVNYHQAARNEIIQRLRNEGYRIYNTSTGHKDLEIFDLLNFKQLKNASKYLVLSKIFFFLSDAPEDKYYQKYEDFKKLYNDAFRTFFLSIDADDDGVQDDGEKGAFKTGLIIRV